MKIEGFIVVSIIVIIVYSCLAFPVHTAILQHENHMVTKNGNTMIRKDGLFLILPDSVAIQGDSAIRAYVLRIMNSSTTDTTEREQPKPEGNVFSKDTLSPEESLPVQDSIPSANSTEGTITFFDWYQTLKAA